MTSEGQDIFWDDIGIRINIPPGAIAEGKDLKLTVQPCLCGQFVLPDDYELASPVYVIGPRFEFRKEIELSICHFADIHNDEDRANISFVSARLIPEDGGSTYKFRLLEKGVFRSGETLGTISLKHFCAIGAARKRKRSAAPDPDESPVKQTKGMPVLYAAIE